MSGHSKWATIKRKKGAADAARGKLFAKLIRFVEVAAHDGRRRSRRRTRRSRPRSRRPATRRCRWTTSTVRSSVATGELEGVSYTEATYEGYAPGGVAVYVTVLTDNKNRAAADVRSTFTKNGGSLGEPGSVAVEVRQDRRRSIVTADGPRRGRTCSRPRSTPAPTTSRPRATPSRCAPSPRAAWRCATPSRTHGLPIESAEVTMIPQPTTPVARSAPPQVLRLVEELEDLDDVQDVYADFDIAEEVLAKLA